MLKQKITILLLGLFFSPLTGFLTVLCHGSDGHTAVEPVIHNHCECPETSAQGELAEFSIEFSADHGHCTDSAGTLNIIVATQKKTRHSTSKIVIGNFFLKSDLSHIWSVYGLTLRNQEFSSFYTPLRTVILLA